MSETATSTQTFYPTLRYADPRAAMAWLVQTFGFAESVLYAADDGGVAHAELSFHGGKVMIGSASHEDGYPVRPPSEVGGLTGGIYTAVPADEIEAHYARTKAAGARFYREITDTDYDSREYSAFDPEGYIWSFGTYQP
jgi:uncharacterized glyoxalase superfamily protein PhnB